MLLKKCWSPCFSSELGSGSLMISFYTRILHMLSFFYFIHVYLGGSSDAFFSPLFEFDLGASRILCIVLTLYSLAYFIVTFLLSHGVQKEIRFMYWPWLVLTLLELVFMFAFGFFLIYRYYHYGWATFAWIALWIYTTFHGYLFWVVVSQYYYLKELQEPTFIILMP